MRMGSRECYNCNRRNLAVHVYGNSSKVQRKFERMESTPPDNRIRLSMAFGEFISGS
jgi:hypothetical protein